MEHSVWRIVVYMYHERARTLRIIRVNERTGAAEKYIIICINMTGPGEFSYEWPHNTQNIECRLANSHLEHAHMHERERARREGSAREIEREPTLWIASQVR